VRAFEEVVLGDVLADHVAHALGARLRREGEPGNPAGGQVAEQLLVEAVGAQRRHRQRHLLVAQPRHGPPDQWGDAGVVGRRQRGERGGVVATAAHAAEESVEHGDGIALAHRPVDHAGLTEAAPLGAAARQLDGHAVEDCLGVWQRRVVGKREAVQVLDPDTAHPGRHPWIEGRADHGEPGGRVSLGRVEGGHVEWVARRETRQQLEPRQPLPSQLRELETQRGQQLLALADEEGVDEGGQGLGVGRHRAPRQHERVARVAVRGTQGQATDVEDAQHRGEVELVLQGEADDVEVAQPRRGLEGQERQPAVAQLLLHVGPRGEDPLGGETGARVDEGVEDPQPEVAHPDLVDVREGERDAHLRAAFRRRAEFPADVTPRLRHARQHLPLEHAADPGRSPVVHSPPSPVPVPPSPCAARRRTSAR